MVKKTLYRKPMNPTKKAVIIFNRYKYETTSKVYVWPLWP